MRRTRDLFVYFRSVETLTWPYCDNFFIFWSLLFLALNSFNDFKGLKMARGREFDSPSNHQTVCHKQDCFIPLKLVP